MKPTKNKDMNENASSNDKTLPLGPTGRHLIVLRPESQKSLLQSLHKTAGLKAASSADFEGAAVSEAILDGHNAMIFEHLGVAVVQGDTDQIRSLEVAVADESNPVLSIEPEMYVIPFNDECDEGEFLTIAGQNYLRGYCDGIQNLSSHLLGGRAAFGAEEAGIAASFADTAALTWGLQATRVDKSAYSGGGIRVAVLDTGFDFKHPDFAGRSIISASFVPGVATAQDGHGHGTHCIGTSCGAKTPAGTARRYGIGYNATILVGKVLSDQGSGQTAWILAGINWAIQNKATVISMSLGSPVMVGQTFSPAYEQAALAALNNNCLIVAAAGNSGQNPQTYPVGSPANCPSVMAVAALDNNQQRASFSCTGANGNGGEVNIAAPGVNVYSTVPMATRYGTMSGTSMATPHVAGCAALWAQSHGLRGKALWQKLEATALKIGLPVQHAGAGLVQAPVFRKIPFPKFPVFPPIPFPEPKPVFPPFPQPDPGPIRPRSTEE